MMSTLSPTLLLTVHCHPGVMFRVSLLPVVKVVVSSVSNEPFDLVLKSFLNAAAVMPAGSGDLFAPPEVNRLSQSMVCVVPPTVVVVLALTSPSSWNARSCTASAMPGAISIDTSAVRTSTTTARRGRRPPVGHLKRIMACLSFMESTKMPAAALRPPPPAGARNVLADATAKRSPWLGPSHPSIPKAHHARGFSRTQN